MTEDEIMQWLVPGAVLAPGTRLRRCVVAALAPLPVPHDNASTFAAFRAFLQSGIGPPGPGRLVEPMPYRILVTGSRTWDDEAGLRLQLDTVAGQHQLVELVSGGCPRGADAIAEKWAADYGIPVERHPAAWRPPGEPFNPDAGFNRNQEMVDAGADVCLAFIRRRSPGATHCARRAKAAGIEVRRFTRE